MGIFVHISNGSCQNGSHLFRFQKVWPPSHSKSEPSANKPVFDHPESGQVWISNPHSTSLSIPSISAHPFPLVVWSHLWITWTTLDEGLVVWRHLWITWTTLDEALVVWRHLWITWTTLDDATESFLTLRQSASMWGSRWLESEIIVIKI